ncbi:MAG: hypothetical protein ACK4TC_09300 [Sphingomonas pseudosanguinis]|uniref:hypothetical protein n=1 Tax=Sphingomonas pseudosanguinis TaxID=413712 RepID=UPI00391C6EE3
MTQLAAMFADALMPSRSTTHHAARRHDRSTVLANRKANVRRMRGRPNAKRVRAARKAKYRSMVA